jgi:hypothetical protein
MCLGCTPESSIETATPRLQDPPIELSNTHVNEGGLSIRYPDGWKVEEINSHIILIGQQDELIGGSVFVPSDEDLQQLGDNLAPRDILINIVIHHTAENIPFNAEEIKSFTIDGVNASSFYYSQEIDELYMVKELPDNHFAILTFAAPKKRLAYFIPTAHEMLISIEYHK